MATRKERFDDSFGPFVDAADVAALVRSGVEVWSFGYGEDQDGDFFTVLDIADIDTAEQVMAGEKAAGFVNTLADVLDEWWGPFRSTDVLTARGVDTADAARQREPGVAPSPLSYEEKLAIIADELGQLLAIYGLESGDDLNDVDEFDTPQEALDAYLRGHAEDILSAIGE